MERISELSIDDIPAILDLEATVIREDGADRIWIHGRSELEDLFAQGKDSLVLGVREGSGLKAVSISRLAQRPWICATPQLDRLWPPEAKAFEGLNTIVRKGGRRGPGMLALLRERRARLSSRGIHHQLGTIPIPYLVSLGCALSLGSRIVGLVEFEGETEFALWHGPDAQKVRNAPDDRRIDMTRIDDIRRAFDDGMTGVGLDRKGGGHLIFSRQPGGADD